MKKLLILLLAGIPVLAGCRLLDEGSSNSPSGTYAYAAFDGDGVLAVIGELQIDARPGETTRSYILEGTWETHSAGSVRPDMGPQIGEGKLTGTVDRDGTFRIDLNPEFRDNNVTLVGVFESRNYDDMEGAWEHATIVGPTADGAFSASRE